MSTFAHISVGALVVVPGPAGTITFVRHQDHGPYGGAWLLPGGRSGFGESLEDAARREAREKAGVVVGAVTEVGLFEMRGTWAGGDYHLLMYAFATVEPMAVPAGFRDRQVDSVRQERPSDMRPHPTIMQILNDAGAADYAQSDIDTGLESVRVVMDRRLAAGASSEAARRPSTPP